jgi:two-component sensor histidine kinase/PAS domain-containing protein
MIARVEGGRSWLGDTAMGTLIGARDWSNTTLGRLEAWPLSLRVSLGICLNALSPLGVCWGRDLSVLYNDAWKAMLGNRHPGVLGVPARELFGEIWDVVGPRIDATACRGEATAVRDQRMRLFRDGASQECSFDFTFNPIPDGPQGTGGVFIIVLETTGRVRAEAEMRLSAQRFRTLAEATSNTLYRMNSTGSDLVELHGGRLSEHPRDNKPSNSWLMDYVHPDDHAETMLAWNHAMRTGTPFERELRVRRDDGSWFWMLSHCVPVRDERHVIIEWIGSAKDIDDRKRAEAALTADLHTLQHDQNQQRVMVAELQHRTRNLLAVVRAIASQTFARSDSAMLKSFVERLASLGRVQGLLSRVGGDRVKLLDIVRAELEPHGRPQRSGIEIHGPDVRLPWHHVQTLALALHELCTNALKYGALKVPAGQLSVTWETWSAGHGRPRLALTWKESGVPMPSNVRQRRGQGRDLIENALRFSLRAETQLVFGADGVWCRIELPLEPAHSGAPETRRVQSAL